MPSHRDVYITRAFLPPLEEFVEGLRAIWATATLTNHGPLPDRLARRLREFLSDRARGPDETVERICGIVRETHRLGGARR